MKTIRINKNRVVAAVIAAVVVVFSLGVGVFAKYVDTVGDTVRISIEKPHYTVTFNANGGAGLMPDQDFTYGVAQQLTSNSFTRNDYSFKEWNTMPDGNGSSFADGASVLNLSASGTGVVTLYAQWEENAMHTVFQMDGTCIFHGYDIQQQTGDGYITGNNCEVNGVNYADGTHKFIDTGVQLYNQNNYEKDYEIGFTIVAYDPSHQYLEPGDSSSQASFLSTKLEDSSKGYPGLVIRRNSNKVEITQTINRVKPTPAQNNAATTINVAVARVDGVVYYSFNDNPFTMLQDINGTSDYFDTTVWFGAATKADGVTPMRFIDATLTNMYVKVGEKGANKHTVSFDADGVISNPADVTVIGVRKIGSALPSLSDQGSNHFEGWYTERNGGGSLVTAGTVIDSDVTFYAYWRNTNSICSVGAATYGTVQECVDAATSSDTVTLLGNTREHIIVSSGTTATINLGGHTLGDNNGAASVIKNFGDLTLLNGTITSALGYGAIDNNSTGKLTVGTDARIVATGTRQAIYNDGGEVLITDNAYLSASSGERATVQNHSNGGKISVEGGTIISVNQQGIKNEAGTLIIGVQDGVIDASTPVIQGATYGITTSNNIAIYDGVLRGRMAAIENPGKITATENGAIPVGLNPEVTEVIDGYTYKILYYQ